MTNQEAPEALRPIQRYKIGYATDSWGTRSSTPSGIPDDAGAWVRYEDLDKAASDVQLLRMGYAAARLEIESLQARIKTMAEEHADELMVAHMDGIMRVALAAAPAQPAPQQEAQEPVSWRELCRRLYVELFYCNQQMTSGKRQKWQQGKTVRDVLADAKAALDAAPQPTPTPQADSALEDAARLDWLALAGPTSICVVIDREHDGDVEVSTDDVTCYGKTLREALDKARKQGANHD